MWSFEKIHHCIAHLFLGELVTTYDEEFRILYAQSQALVIENALVPLPRESCYSSNKTQSFRGHQPMQNTRYASNSRHPFVEKIDMDCNMFPFRRGEPFHNPIEPSHMQMYSNVHPSNHLRMEQSSMEQGRSVVTSRKMEMAHKRHSYAEGSHDSYGSSRQFTRHRGMTNMEEMEAQSTHLYKEHHYYHGVGPGSGHGINDNVKSQGYTRTDQYFDTGYPLEIEPPGSYSRIADYLSTSSSNGIIHDSVNVIASGEGDYSANNPKRVSMSQSYICQTSPTQLHPPDLRPVITEACLNQQPQDPSMKQGLRKWRINSYLSAFEDQEDEALAVPLGPDPFDELPSFSEAKCTPQPPVSMFNTEEFPRIATSKQDLIPQYSRLNQPEVQKHPSGKHTSMTTDSKVIPEASVSSTTIEGDKEGEVEIRESRQISITKQESFRSRVNPMLQRSSRLRSSLIFSSCNLEQYSSAMMKSASGLDYKENRIQEEKNDPLKTSSVVAQILEKRPSVTKEQSSNISVMVKEPAFQEATQKPTETLIDKPPISSTSAEPISNKSELENKTPAVVKQPAGPDLQYTDSQTSADVPAAIKGSPKLLKDILKPPEDSQGPNISCDEQLYRDATDIEKHEIKEANRHSATSITITDPGKSLQNKLNSTSNLSLTGGCAEDKQDVKAMQFMEKHTQNLRGALGTQGDQKVAAVVAEDSVVPQIVSSLPEDKKAPCLESHSHTEAKQAIETVVTKSKEEIADHRPLLSAASKASQSRYQTSTSRVIYSSNLRDDTKVILEQISASSQNRIDLTKKAAVSTDDASLGKDERTADMEGTPPKPHQGGTRFQHTQQERENLLKRIESMRKQKKVYSRFEMGP
ncbi:hypothetical protein SKAU_G00211690 [Synaphobranchus kaupii]|uniref:Scaffolding anchor of CK1 domain-containing protein n=1 Tax=Synaphobranchus kaupii TaxID=118154 RepID=A0A9Q1F990_SYNKA|nr:hypothetical protein SKAU_G00211690 [Synaphobranchus kaupii]